MVERNLESRQQDARLKIAEGAALMRLGVTETVKSEITHAGAMGVVGGAVGLVAWAWNGKSESVWEWAKKFGRWGLISGWFAGSANYNDYAREADLPRVRWYDTLLASFVADRAVEQKGPFSTASRPVRLVVPQLINPLTTLGIRTTVGGVRDLLMASW